MNSGKERDQEETRVGDDLVVGLAPEALAAVVRGRCGGRDEQDGQRERGGLKRAAHRFGVYGRPTGDGPPGPIPCAACPRPAFPLSLLAVLVAGLAAAGPAAAPAVHARGGAPVVDGVPHLRRGDDVGAAHRMAALRRGRLDGRAGHRRRRAGGCSTTLRWTAPRRAAACWRGAPAEDLAAARWTCWRPRRPAGRRRPASGPEPIPTLAEALVYARDSGATVSLEIADRAGEPGFDPARNAAGRVMDAVVASGVVRRAA